jgi:hypothetical protein
MDREKFVRRQTSITDLKLSLTSGEESSRERFLQLALETYDSLISMGATMVPSDFDPWPESGGNPLSNPPRIELTPDLVQRWKRWNDEYYEIRSRNPRLELRDMMQEMSESDTASSWPRHFQERSIQDWVDAGDPAAPPPFDDRYDIVTPEFFERLRELRQLCGGWLYWDSSMGRVVFAPESEWQSVRSAQEAAEAKEKKHWQEVNASMQRSAIRVEEVLSIARSDTVFWEELRAWELKREAKRPSALPSSSASLPTPPLQLRRISAEEQANYENLSVDPIFEAFIDRVRQAEDVLTVRGIVVTLRREMRREIGLDSVVGWPGGPDLGVA